MTATGRVVRNPDALRTDRVPETVQGREAALDQLAFALGPLAEGGRGFHPAIFGPAGAGKTTVAKHAVDALQQEAPEVRTGYVSAMTNSGRRDTLYELLDGMVPDLALPKQGTASADLFDGLRDLGAPAVAIVDEVNQLQDQGLLAGLYGVPDLVVVPITIDGDRWFAEAPSAVASRFRSGPTVRLDPYGPDDLRDILAHRADVGLEPGVLGDGALEAIAERAGGDARFAISMLAQGASAVQRGGAGAITPDVVDDVEEEARVSIRERYVERLDTHQALLYDIVVEAGEIRAEAVHEQFLSRTSAEVPPSKRTRTRYLEALRQYGMIELVGEGRGAAYQVV